MRINPQVLTIDVKVQDSFREKLADLSTGNVKAKCVVLGDSDIDYEISQDMNNARILNAPFNVEAIKYPLIFDGAGGGLEGVMTCFARKVVGGGVVQSMYEYPNTEAYITGRTPPPLTNGLDFQEIVFDSSKMGYILYFQTLLNNYVDTSSGLMKRLNEKINVEVTFNGSANIPNNWRVIKDEGVRVASINGANYKLFNNSILIGKMAGANLAQNANGKIKITGSISNITKTINFNI